MLKNKENKLRFPDIDLSIKFGQIIGSLRFLAESDLGSITKNETAQELLEEVQEARQLLKEIQAEQTERILR
tara:strand:- start:378 stop:593 length:216 start_codon:yes stop_codon:yes gene_type:complete